MGSDIVRIIGENGRVLLASGSRPTAIELAGDGVDSVLFEAMVRDNGTIHHATVHCDR